MTFKNDIDADLILTGGVIYSADKNDTIYEAIAIKGKKIIYCGTEEAAKAYKGDKTTIINLRGKMVMPSMLDTHLHPPGLALSELYEVQLTGKKSISEYISTVREFLIKHPAMKMIYGRGWSWGILEGEELVKGPKKEYLDEISTDIPIVLRASDGHTLWVNSKALEVNKIDGQTLAPNGGIIEKNEESQEPWGTLKESAMGLIELPQYSELQYIIALETFQKKMHSLGITGILCLGSLPFKTIFKAFNVLDKAQKLKLYVRGAMTISPKEDIDEQLSTIEKMRTLYTSPKLQVTTAKFFTDGVVEGCTSHLLEPYDLRANKGANYYGEFLWEPAKLIEAFRKTNQRGIQIHVHSTGNGSTHKVLNALEAISNDNIKADCRNTITHLQLVADSDIARFKKLNVIASVQPYWHFKGPNWWENVDYRYLGTRAEKEFPLHSFFERNIIVTSSSDYPATLVPNPMLAIDIGVTRNIDNGLLHGVQDIEHIDGGNYILNKAERTSVVNMLKSFTCNSAYALFLEDTIGTIEVGKSADFVVLSHNLLTIDNLTEIDKTEVLMTFFEGELVYAK